MGADLSGQGRGGLVLAVFGPTASGKSAVAEALAERIPGEVVSADSMQAYRGLPILTNQPARPTRLVGIWPLDHEGSVGEYQRLAHAAIDEVFAAGRTPIIAGGTGLYLRAALAELNLPPARSARSPRALGASLRRGWAGGRPRPAGRARSGRGRGCSSQRPPPRRASTRAGRGGRLVGPRDRPALERRHPPADAHRRPGRPGGDSEPTNRRAHAGHGAARSAGRGGGRMRRAAFVHGATRNRPGRIRHPGPGRGDRRRDTQDEAVRRLPAQVASPSPRRC